MYKPGAILKVTVTNFVTYTYAEMYPGPNLNMIIGSNGTGKSTMVAAIILGLGGNISAVGRGTKISEYVKHNCSEAKIDILLNDIGSDEPILISREFNIHERTTWKLNHKKTTFKEIEERIKKYNIQVDNLCQFLPQDRVQDFAKMNKQELLKQTKKAICREDLVKRQELLIEKRKRHKELMDIQEKQKQKLQELKDANVRLEGKVKNFNTRKKYKSYIKDVNRKLAWIDYESLIMKRNEIKTDKAQAAELYSQQKNAAKPIEESISKTKQIIINLQNLSKNTDAGIKALEDQINVDIKNVSKLKDTIGELKIDMNTKINEIEGNETEINSSTMKLDQLSADRAEIIKMFGNDQKITEKVQRFNNEIRQISTQVTLIQEKKQEILSMKREKDYEIRALENELRRIENVKQQRLEWLRRADIDAYNGTLWLRQNKHLFKGEVYEPMMLELNVINSDNAKYIENTIPIQDRVAFTCTLKEDMNLLIRLLRNQQQLSVNVVHSGLDQPSFQSYQPRIPIEQLKKYGLYAYLHTLFTGPEAIMKYLCRTYRIHCMPIGNESTNLYFEDVPQEINNFFSTKFRFSTSYSKYTREKSTRQVGIHSDGSLSVSVDAIRLEEIKSQINQSKHVCETQDNEIRELENQITQLNERNSKLRQNLQVVRGSKQRIETIDSRIRLINNKINQMKQMRTNKDEVKQITDSKIQDVIIQLIKVQRSTQNKYKEYSNYVIKKNLDLVKQDMHKKQVLILENKSYDIRRLCQEAEETLNHIKEAYTNITNQAKQALTKAKDLSNGFTPEDEGFEEFRPTYNSLPDSVEELESEKERIGAKIDCMRTADATEMREYDERVKMIEKLEDKIIQANTEMEEIEGNMGRLREEYMTPLQELVENIDQRFGAAFQKMGLAGEVTVYKGDNENDYEQYGLSIRVTYRSGQPLQELNMLTQSGGERAVATAAYLLSLQELTPVPFRCADEINQGMDPDNERRIFELLVLTTSQRDTSQYFLITPKLVSNLSFPETMKIHVIHNAPFIPSQEQWNRVRI